MKKLLFVLCVILTVCGCMTTLPTTEKAAKSAHSIGVSAALVCNITKLDSETATIINDIVYEIKDYSTTYSISKISDASKSIIELRLDSLRHDGKITQIQEELIVKVTSNIVNSIDYMVNKRWPTIEQYSDLLNTIVYNFSEGFLSAYHPVNIMANSSELVYDVEVYDYLMKLQH